MAGSAGRVGLFPIHHEWCKVIRSLKDDFKRLKKLLPRSNKSVRQTTGIHTAPSHVLSWS